MVAPHNTDTRLDGLEKVVGDLEKMTETLATMVNELKIQCLKMDKGVSMLGSQLEMFRVEMGAAFFYGNPNSTTGLFPKDSANGHGSNTKIPGGTPPITIPTFDGSNAIAWLARVKNSTGKSRECCHGSLGRPGLTMDPTPYATNSHSILGPFYAGNDETFW